MQRHALPILPLVHSAHQTTLAAYLMLDHQSSEQYMLAQHDDYIHVSRLNRSGRLIFWHTLVQYGVQRLPWLTDADYAIQRFDAAARQASAAHCTPYTRLLPAGCTTRTKISIADVRPTRRLINGSHNSDVTMCPVTNTQYAWHANTVVLGRHHSAHVQHLAYPAHRMHQTAVLGEATTSLVPKARSPPGCV
jgi:hypothetical protein